MTQEELVRSELKKLKTLAESVNHNGSIVHIPGSLINFKFSVEKRSYANEKERIQHKIAIIRELCAWLRQDLEVRPA